MIQKIRIELLEDDNIKKSYECKIEYSPILEIYYGIGSYIAEMENANERKPWLN